MITEKNSTYLFVGNVSRGSVTNVSNLPNRAVAVVNAATGQVLTSAPASDLPIKVVMKTSKGKLIQSPVFVTGDIKYKGVDASSGGTDLDVQQISYLGATSVSSVNGIGTPTAGNTYVVNVIMRNLGLVNTTPEIRFGAYKAQTGDGQFELVTGLKDSFDRQLNNPYDFVIVDRVCNGTGTALTADLTVTNKSTVVGTTQTTDIPGKDDIVKILGVAYKVVSSVSGTSITLDRPYTGTSGTVDYQDTNTGKYTSVTAWGLRFSGVRQEFNADTDSIEGQLLSFDIYSSDLTVTEYKAQTATPVINDGARVAYLERYSQFLHKQPVVSSVPPTTYNSEADPTVSYDIYNLSISGDVFGSITIGAQYSTATTIVIAIKESLNSEAISTIFGIS